MDVTGVAAVVAGVAGVIGKVSKTFWTARALIDPAKDTAAGSGNDATGITVLYELDLPELDIVFIHGLGGHPVSTWRHLDPQTQRQVLWPVDLLAKRIPRARILSFGYSSEIPSSRYLTQKTLHFHALRLLDDLSRLRTKSQNRPLVFIAHSLGGIVVKSALIFASQKTDAAMKAIQVSTSGVVFLGTPHEESKKMSWQGIMKKIVSLQLEETVLRSFEDYSKKLQMQLEPFKSLVGDFPIISFYEENSTGSEILVDQQSSTIQGGLTDADASSLALARSHSRMAEFTRSNDLEYLKVADNLDYMYKKAGQRTSSTKENPYTSEASFNGEFQLQPAIPYPRNPRFVPQEIHMKKLDDLIRNRSKMDQDHPIVVLNGPAGTGKTQLALEYSYLHQNEFTSIFWIDASTRERIRISFQRIVIHAIEHYMEKNRQQDLENFRSSDLLRRQLGISKIDKDPYTFSGDGNTTYLIRNLLDWFARDDNTRWLLIYDNLCFPGSQAEIVEFLPRSFVGSIIITTQETKSIPFGTSLPIEGFSPKEAALALLGYQKQPKTDRDREAAWYLARRLKNLPLRISEEGDSIDRTSACLERYCRLLFGASNQSFDLGKVDIEAKVMLQVCSMFSNDPIPLEFGDRFGNGRPFFATISDLASIGYVTMNYAQTEFLVRPAVREFLRANMSERERSAFERFGSEVLVDAMSNQQVHDYSFERFAWIPLIKSCLSWNGIDRSERAALAAECERQGFDSEASTLYETTLEKIGEEWWGDWPAKLRIDRGLTLLSQGLFGKANESFASVAKVLDQQANPDRRLRARTLRGIASLHMAQQQYADAEPIYTELIRWQEKHEGLDHPYTLESIHSLAECFRKQGRHAEAECFYRRLMSSHIRLYREDHPISRDTCKKLAIILQQQGKFKEAESLYHHTLLLEQQIHGNGHPRTLSIISKLATLKDTTLEFEESTMLHREALTGLLKHLGNTHPDILEVKENMARGFHIQGDHAEAERHYREVLEAKAATPELYSKADRKETAWKLVKLYRDYDDKKADLALKDLRLIDSNVQHAKAKGIGISSVYANGPAFTGGKPKKNETTLDSGTEPNLNPSRPSGLRYTKVVHDNRGRPDQLRHASSVDPFYGKKRY